MLAIFERGKFVVTLSNRILKARIQSIAYFADKALSDNLKSYVQIIEEVSQYIIFSGGKRLRQVIFILITGIISNKIDVTLSKISTIFEYLHAATLLHDDVVDEAGLRRGRLAARVEYNNDVVILVGDFLFSKSYSLAAEVNNHHFIRALTDCTVCMAEGQVLELIYSGNLILTYDSYLQVIVAKTAILLATVCQMGALISGADESIVDVFYNFGMNLGIAFQMIDDALDYVGTEHEFGKPVGNDLIEGKITLPFIYARNHAVSHVCTCLLTLAKDNEVKHKSLNRVKEIVCGLGGVEATYAYARAYAFLAQEALRSVLTKLKFSAELETLLGLPYYVLTRRS